MKYVMNKKGQAIVEFAMLMAFAVFFGIAARDSGMGHAIKHMLEPTSVELARVDHNRTYDVKKVIYGNQKTGDEEIVGLKSMQFGYVYGGDAYGGSQYHRGMVRSGWINEYDSTNQFIKDMSDEIGASQWSYISGEGRDSLTNPNPTDNNYYGSIYPDIKHLDLAATSNLNLEDAFENDKNLINISTGKRNKGIWQGDIGMYWTVEVLDKLNYEFHYMYPDLATNNSDGTDKTRWYFSRELVLQYFYSELTGRYYVIKNYIWIQQTDVANKYALAALHQQWHKPPGVIIGNQNGYATIEQAKEVFESERLKTTVEGYHEEGSVIFQYMTADEEDHTVKTTTNDSWLNNT